MNQAAILSTPPVSPQNKSSNALSSSDIDKNERAQGTQAFSDEFEKQLEHQKTSEKKSEKLDAKSDKESAQVSNKSQKDGKSLPEKSADTKTETVDKASKIDNESVEENVDSEFTLNIDATEQVEGSDEQTDTSLIDAKQIVEVEAEEQTEISVDQGAELQTKDQDDTGPKGLIQTETLHAVVKDIKQTAQQATDPETNPSSKSALGQLVSDTVKNMTKPNSDKVVAGEVSKPAPAMTLTDAELVSQDKLQQQTPSSKLRPDILEAMSLRAAEQKQAESTKPDSLLAKVEVAIKNNASGIELPEVLETVKAKLPSASALFRDSNLPPGLTALTGQTTAIGIRAESASPVLDIQPAMQSAAWTKVMASRVLWMAREGVQQASLKLNPSNLGPVEVRLHMQNEQASVSFIAQNAMTRDALDQALPRLRESFLQNGLELTDANVSQHSSGDADNTNQSETDSDSDASHQAAAQQEENGDIVETVLSETQDDESGLSIYA